MNEFNRHLIDCSLGWIIAFMTALIAVEELTLRVVLVSLLGAGVPALIKLREYNISKMNKRGCRLMHTIFY